MTGETYEQGVAAMNALFRARTAPAATETHREQGESRGDGYRDVGQHGRDAGRVDPAGDWNRQLHAMSRAARRG